MGEDAILSAFMQVPFVAIMVYMVQRFLLHLDSRDDEWRKFTVTQNNRVIAQLNEQRRALEALSVLLIRHDATVRGVNPDHVGTTEELLRHIHDT